MKNNFESISSPVECYKLKFISVYLFLLFITSAFCNLLLLVIIYKYKRFRNTLNIYMFFLTLFNLIGTFVELPATIATNFACRWLFQEIGCMISGFMMYLIGCTSIYIMALVSLERYCLIYNSFKTKIDVHQVVFSVLLCFILGFIWAILPIFGWSHYSLEGAYTSCSVEWNEKSFNVVSYNITIFITVFIIPIAVISFTNLKLIFMIQKLNLIYQKFDYVYQRKKYIGERKATFSMILIIAGFVVSWTPYAMVSMYRVFVDQNVSPMAGTIPAMFAKSTLLWTSLLYIYSNRKIRAIIKKLMLNV
ncbi:melanopsin [Brachionus plicatilis]|uniref:Melanopsin n=1 Tax=Brachionus plicatilis TaxID=10195 RepID=A0A3M7RZ05_BRAPC|nr:melanopsin [Brachionus plicatilis]